MADEKHANDEYANPGAEGPPPMPPVLPDDLAEGEGGLQGKSDVDGGVVAGGGIGGAEPDAGAGVASDEGDGDTTSEEQTTTRKRTTSSSKS